MIFFTKVHYMLHQPAALISIAVSCVARSELRRSPIGARRGRAISLPALIAGAAAIALICETSTAQFVSALQFCERASYPAGGNLIAVGDFNGDGKVDFVTAHFDAGTIAVALGNGDGTFGSITNYAVGEGLRWVATGDLNGDGLTDIVATYGYEDGRLAVFTARSGGKPSRCCDLAR